MNDGRSSHPNIPVTDCGRRSHPRSSPTAARRRRVYPSPAWRRLSCMSTAVYPSPQALVVSRRCLLRRVNRLANQKSDISILITPSEYGDGGVTAYPQAGRMLVAASRIVAGILAVQTIILIKIIYMNVCLNERQCDHQASISSLPVGCRRHHLIDAPHAHCAVLHCDFSS